MKTTRQAMTTIRYKVNPIHEAAAVLWLDQLTPDVLNLIDQAMKVESAQQNPALFRVNFSASMVNALLEARKGMEKRGPGRPPKVKPEAERGPHEHLWTKRDGIDLFEGTAEQYAEYRAWQASRRTANPAIDN